MPTIPIVYLTPITDANVNVSNLAMFCKTNVLPYLYIRVADEDLTPNASNTVFYSKFPNWLMTPNPKIITISNLGVETLRYITTNYTINALTGTVTFLAPTTDIVRASYNAFPLTDAQIVALTQKSLKEISVLTYRTIDENNIHSDYQIAICRRLYTNIFQTLMVEARDFYAVSVAGRTINKTNIMSQMTAIIQQNEALLEPILNMLRTFNKTNRVLPAVPVTKTINSDAKVV
jgi:hypothetical protein